MAKFIIELQTKVNGKFQKGFHQDIKPSNSKEAMNVYEQHVTSKKKEAKVFYDKEEAEKVGSFFAIPNIQSFKVVPA